MASRLSKRRAAHGSILSAAWIAASALVLRDCALLAAICAAPSRRSIPTPEPRPTSTSWRRACSRRGTLGFDGAPSTYMEPLYPRSWPVRGSSPATRLAVALILQVAVASIGGVLLDRLASRHAGPRAGLFAALFYASIPTWCGSRSRCLEITLCTTLAIAAALALSRADRIRGALTTGALFGLLMLTRTSFAVAAIGAAAAWLAWQAPSTRLGAAARSPPRCSSPPFWSRSPGWFGTRASTGRRCRPGWARTCTCRPRSTDRWCRSTTSTCSCRSAWRTSPRTSSACGCRRPLEERAMDDAMLRHGLAFVREHPGRVLWLKARNFLYLFSAAAAAARCEVVRRRWRGWRGTR